jgi:cell division protein FtsB
MTVDGLFVGVVLFALGGLFVYLLREREVTALVVARDALADVCTKQHMALAKREAEIADLEQYIADHSDATAEELGL